MCIDLLLRLNSTVFDILARCKVGENSIDVGDSFSVKAPKDQADIILVVEQDTRNEKIFKDLIPTLITDLREELKHHGITYASLIYLIIILNKLVVFIVLTFLWLSESQTFMLFCLSGLWMYTKTGHCLAVVPYLCTSIILVVLFWMKQYYFQWDTTFSLFI